MSRSESHPSTSRIPTGSVPFPPAGEPLFHVEPFRQEFPHRLRRSRLNPKPLVQPPKPRSGTPPPPASPVPREFAVPRGTRPLIQSPDSSQTPLPRPTNTGPPFHVEHLQGDPSQLQPSRAQSPQSQPSGSARSTWNTSRPERPHGVSSRHRTGRRTPSVQVRPRPESLPSTSRVPTGAPTGSAVPRGTPPTGTPHRVLRPALVRPPRERCPQVEAVPPRSIAFHVEHPEPEHPPPALPPSPVPPNTDTAPGQESEHPFPANGFHVEHATSTPRPAPGLFFPPLIPSPSRSAVPRGTPHLLPAPRRRCLYRMGSSWVLCWPFIDGPDAIPVEAA